MRLLDRAQTGERLRWLNDHWSTVYAARSGATGYDPDAGWAAAAWVLHAMYERPDLAPGLSHHEVHQQAIAAGLREPAMVGDVNIDDVATTTGVGLGFQYRPDPRWRRLTWSELGQRDGFDFWAVAGRWPRPSFTPQSEWADPAVLPASSRPHIGPTTADSWPASIVPPPEGSLEEESLQALIAVLSEHTAPAALRDCSAHYGLVLFMAGCVSVVYAGELGDVPALVESRDGTRFTPSNIWPADRSWLVYTDFDLLATRVSGSAELIDALCADTRLDTVRCGGYPRPAAPPPTGDVAVAHHHCRDHRDELARSTVCGCFHCCAIFPPAQITEWIDPSPEMVDEVGRDGQTALCPKCRIDSVIGDRSGYPITGGFLRRMKAHWF